MLSCDCLLVDACNVILVGAIFVFFVFVIVDFILLDWNKPLLTSLCHLICGFADHVHSITVLYNSIVSCV